jgi:3-hydroxybutyryl-CoA dehydrogenase
MQKCLEREMSDYQILRAGPSRSFPGSHALLEGASNAGRGIFVVGDEAGAAYLALAQRESFDFVAIELGSECLGVHTGESIAGSPANVVGFARFRLGNANPSTLVEIVKQPQTRPESVAGVRAALASAKLVSVVCNDFPGRIIDRLIRPFYNALLRRLDEGLASAEDLDKTLCLGLGYPEGPLALLQRTGLSDHFEVSRQLFEALGQEPYAPARRAQVAHAIKSRR